MQEDGKFTGGIAEEGETLERCFQRELNEELNIEIKVNRFFCDSAYKYPKGRIQLYAYIVEIVNGEM